MEFRQLVKMIHPDHNPDIVDAGGKMALVVANKTNPLYLQKLAARWGLLPRIYNIKDNVAINFQGQTTYGVIVDIVKMYSSYNIVILNLNTKRILVAAHSDLSKEHDSLNVLGKADSELWAAVRTLYDLYKEHKRADRPSERQRPIYERVYINPNCVYNDGTEAHISTAHVYGWYRVIRTTARRVYYYNPILGRETYTNIDNVVRGRKL